MPYGKTELTNLSFPKLEAFVLSLGQPKFRTSQLWQWIWRKNAASFEEMTNLSLSFREILQEKATITWPTVHTMRESKDGTVKFLLALADGALIETVLIPSSDREGSGRMTQCLSCQVGCAMACTFCSTGSLGFTRNMTMGEILGQVQVARTYLGDTRPDHPLVRNLVFMGMGEPLLNLDEIMRSLKALHHSNGLAFSARRITVSTCGLPRGLEELGESGLAYLALSLHAPTQELRSKLMPKAANWPLDKLLAALAAYPLKTREHLTLEYLLIGGLNDQPAHAQELARICLRLKAKVNLIVYNPTPDSPYMPSSPEAVLAFEKVLWEKKITAIVRKSKGQDINAACGQLRAEIAC